MAKVTIGTELKLNINIQPMDSLSMDDYDFEVEVYCTPKKSIIIQKSSAIKVDENNYIILVDTNAVGVGRIKCKVTAQIPDADFIDDYRTEVVCADTGIDVIKPL